MGEVPAAHPVAKDAGWQGGDLCGWPCGAKRGGWVGTVSMLSVLSPSLPFPLQLAMM